MPEELLYVIERPDGTWIKLAGDASAVLLLRSRDEALKWKRKLDGADLRIVEVEIVEVER